MCARRHRHRALPAEQFVGDRRARRLQRDLLRQEQGQVDGEQNEEVDDHLPDRPRGFGDHLLHPAIRRHLGRRCGMTISNRAARRLFIANSRLLFPFFRNFFSFSAIIL